MAIDVTMIGDLILLATMCGGEKMEVFWALGFQNELEISIDLCGGEKMEVF